jgi:MobA/MobL family
MPTYHLCIKSGKKGKARNHSVYITRDGKFNTPDKRSDLITTQHGNLPEWAGNDPKRFWKAADIGERANGSAYRELEIALPSELPSDENLKLVKAFVEIAIPGKPFEFAIHAPMASIGKVSQPHAHVMFQDRIDDGIDRSPEQYFKRFNPAHPELGGAKKSSGGKNSQAMKTDLIELRELWANMQNEKLAQHNIEARVDHRSNKERGIEKKPERHLGFCGVNKLCDDERKHIKASRSS